MAYTFYKKNKALVVRSRTLTHAKKGYLVYWMTGRNLHNPKYFISKRRAVKFAKKFI